jgi:hypothetical protein
LAGDQGIVVATEKMETFAQKVSDALVGATDLFLQFSKFGSIKAPESSQFQLAPSLFEELANRGKKVRGTDKQYGGVYAAKYLGEVEAANAAARKKADEEAKKRAAATAKSLKAQADLQAKILKDKKLANAIDKAKLLLGKGEGVFDIEAIQNNAALINQAEQLGRTTSAAQMLQIANDTARLNLKKSMYELEQAIAAGDIVAIQNATARLNEDIKIFNALSGQKTQMMAIESILAGLKPKELIDQKNLDIALQKIRDMLTELSKLNASATAKLPTSASLGSGIPAGDYIAPVDKKTALAASTSALLEYADSATARANAFADLLDMQNEADELALNEYMAKLASSSSATKVDMSSTVPVATAAAIQSGNRYAAQAANYYNISINAGIGSDPNAIAEALNQYVVDAVDRGTLRSGAL